MRFAIRKGYARKITKEYTEPKTSGMDKNKSKVAAYIGCRTTP